MSILRVCWFVFQASLFWVWDKTVRGFSLAVRGQGPSNPLMFHQASPSTDAMATSTDYPALDQHQIDRDSLWKMFCERREQERQRKLSGTLNELFGNKLRAFRESGLPSPTVPLDAFDASARAAIAYAATMYRLGPVEHPDTFGEDDAD